MQNNNYTMEFRPGERKLGDALSPALWLLTELGQDELKQTELVIGWVFVVVVVGGGSQER